ncbi:hypothetical protein DZF79_14100 [Vibrio parahaemolyticus]|nr:hypothetical protein [Vibrio parahaemolyticus]
MDVFFGKIMIDVFDTFSLLILGFGVMWAFIFGLVVYMRHNGGKPFFDDYSFFAAAWVVGGIVILWFLLIPLLSYSNAVTDGAFAYEEIVYGKLPFELLEGLSHEYGAGKQALAFILFSGAFAWICLLLLDFLVLGGLSNERFDEGKETITSSPSMSKYKFVEYANVVLGSMIVAVTVFTYVQGLSKESSYAYYRTELSISSDVAYFLQENCDKDVSVTIDSGTMKCRNNTLIDSYPIYSSPSVNDFKLEIILGGDIGKAKVFYAIEKDKTPPALTPEEMHVASVEYLRVMTEALRSNYPSYFSDDNHKRVWAALKV